MPKFKLSAAFALALALPAMAAVPTFETAAPTAYLIDLSSGAVLFAKDADRRMPPASMAKMMTTHVVFDMLKHGEIKAEQAYQVRPATWEKWHGPSAGSTMFLSPNESVSVDNLLKGLITLSGNDACVVLAEGISGSEAAFVARMNETAAKLGLTNSRFGTSNGWPDEGRTYTTARDLAKLARATIEQHPELYKKYYSLKEFSWGKTVGKGAAITQPNRDPLLGRVAGADGLKTGHTEEAGYGFTGSAEQNGRRLVMVVAGIDSFNNRISESVKFMQWGFDAWAARPLLKAGKIVGEADVQAGWSPEVDLVTPNAVSLTLPKGVNARATAKIVYSGPVRAPIEKGQHIADLVVSAPGMGPQITPLVAAEAVSKAGFFGRVWAGLLSFF